MAVLRAGDQGVDFGEIDVSDLLEGDLQGSSTQVKVVFDATSYVLFGGSFTYAGNGDLSGGTITSVTSVDAGKTLFTLTGTSTSAATFVGYVQANNTPAALAALFAANDTLYGSKAKDILAGFAGNDQIFGAAGDDSLVGLAGKDTLDGGTGKDVLVGGLGDDVYYVDAPQDYAVENEGQGVDQVFASTSYVLTPFVENLTLTGSSKINGGGNSLANIIKGNGASNSLLGSGGYDTLSGGDGNDTLDGGVGKDKMTGGKGDDVYVVDSKDDKVVEDKRGGTDLVASKVSYTLGGNLEQLQLLGTDKIKGTGNSVANVIVGNDAANSLYGKDGADTLSGGKGDDRLIGGKGADKLTGGAGKDVFAFDDGDFGGKTTKTADKILDFAKGTDKIDLSPVDAVPGGKDSAFKFIGKDAFHGVAGELRYEISGGHTLITGDLNGDKSADFMIYVEQKIDLTKGDFIL